MKRFGSFILLLLISSLSFGQYNSTFGGPFSPRGDIRFLVIYAGFESSCNDLENTSWPPSSSGKDKCNSFPIYHNELFYSDYAQFSPDAKDFTISNFYYQMSKNHPEHPPLRIVADVFPERINISGGSANNDVLFKKIQEKYPDFDWSRYDNRKNYSDFKFDNSKTEPDHVLDYVIVVWRAAGCGGYANTNNFTFTTNAKGFKEEYKVYSSCGFTILRSVVGAYQIKKLFHHEFAHSLFNCPHVFAANGVCGNYFYSSTGWGTMSYGIINSSANAWEAWYNGWIELPPSKDLSRFTQNGVYILKDFITTGDAMRIKLPFSNQYLWIENHAGINYLDQREGFSTDGSLEPIPSPDKGLFMFVENIVDSRSQHLIPLAYKFANGLKAMHGNGNYDYQAMEYSIDPRWWGNIVVNFNVLSPNPTSAHNDVALIRDNYAFDTLMLDKIIFLEYTNSPSDPCYMCSEQCDNSLRQESVGVIKKNNRYTFDNLGLHMAFGNGQLPQKVGISSNPMIINHQRYLCPDRLEPIYLHGVSINILSKASNGDITIEVKFDDTQIVSDQLMTGELILNDIENASNDLEIQAGKTLTIDKSGTPNRYNKGSQVKGRYEYPDFINPSILIIEKGATVVVNDEAQLLVKNGSSLLVRNEGRIILKGTGKVEVRNGSYFFVEEGAVIEYQGIEKTINTRKKARQGINPLLKWIETKK